ncbi:hypothetical protein J3R30DRAFT_3235337, partial [Lentinula aciculospora]
CDCPYKCYGKARELLDTLPQKWNLSGTTNTTKYYENEDTDDKVDENSCQFNQRLTTNGSLSDVFQIFMEGEECNE